MQTEGNLSITNKPINNYSYSPQEPMSLLLHCTPQGHSRVPIQSQFAMGLGTMCVHKVGVISLCFHELWVHEGSSMEEEHAGM